jgi:hypothetical protein
MTSFGPKLIVPVYVPANLVVTFGLVIRLVSTWPIAQVRALDFPEFRE